MTNLVLADVDEASALRPITKVKAWLPVAIDGGKSLQEMVIPLAQVMVLCQGSIITVELQIPVLEFGPSTGDQVSRMMGSLA